MHCRKIDAAEGNVSLYALDISITRICEQVYDVTIRLHMRERQKCNIMKIYIGECNLYNNNHEWVISPICPSKYTLWPLDSFKSPLTQNECSSTGWALSSFCRLSGYLNALLHTYAHWHWQDVNDTTTSSICEVARMALYHFSRINTLYSYIYYLHFLCA